MCYATHLKRRDDATIIDQLTCALEARGYVVNATPIPGEEALFISTLREGVRKVEAENTRLQNVYGFRGRAKRTKLLHIALPEPVWGVAVRS
jgi:hypothetical protein